MGPNWLVMRAEFTIVIATDICRWGPFPYVLRYNDAMERCEFLLVATKYRHHEDFVLNVDGDWRVNSQSRHITYDTGGVKKSEATTGLYVVHSPCYYQATKGITKDEK